MGFRSRLCSRRLGLRVASWGEKEADSKDLSSMQMRSGLIWRKLINRNITRQHLCYDKLTPFLNKSSCSTQQKNNQHSSVSLLISTLILRSNPTLIHLGRSNLKQLLLTCTKTSAAPKLRVTSPEELLINLQLLLDSKTPTYSLLSFILPPANLIPWNRSMLLSSRVMIPFFPSLLRIYFVTSCLLPLSS